MRLRLILILSPLLLALACTEDSQVAAPPDQFNLALSGLPDSASAPTNWTRQFEFAVHLRNPANLPVAGQTIRFSALPAVADITPSQVITDAGGLAAATVSVTLPAGQTTLKISAESDRGGASALIALRGFNPPQTLNLTLDPPELYVFENQDAAMNLTALITDSAGVGVPGMTVRFALEPPIPGELIFGSLDAAPPTDAAGVTSTVFHSRGGSGVLYLIYYLDNTPPGDMFSGRMQIRVRRVLTQVGSLRLSAAPDLHRMQADSVGLSMVTAAVTDVNGVVMPGLFVQFSIEYGSLSRPTLTDNQGAARVEFRMLPLLDFPNPDTSEFTTWITATLPGSQFTAQTPIRWQNPIVPPLSLQLTSDKTVIYADNGITKANLTALLRDSRGIPLASREISFTSTHGVVTSSAVTDSLGRARAVFSDVGLPSLDPEGRPIPAVITAIHEPSGTVAIQEITILELGSVRTISLISAAGPFIHPRDTTSIVVTCIAENGERSPDGITIFLRKDSPFGRFVPESGIIQGGDGAGEFLFIAGIGRGRVRIWAVVYNSPTDSAVSNNIFITLLPGPPHSGVVTFRRIGADYQITATIKDAYDNPVDGIRVSFTSSLGYIYPTEAYTDTLGQAFSIFRPGPQVGNALITISVNGPNGPITATTTITVLAGSPKTIELTASPRSIQPHGAGGVEASTVQSLVKDANGNPVASPTWVYFELLQQPDPPEGCNINFRGQQDSAQTSNSFASVTVNSGTQSGTVLVRAWTFADPERQDTIQTVVPLLVVTAGTPLHLDVDFNDEGRDGGGGAWLVEVAARVTDLYHNPVGDSIPVIFTLTPQVAAIAPAFTGNWNWDGRKYSGMAYTTLTYNSENTFETVRVTARVSTADSLVSTEVSHVLPLQFGELDLNVSPESFEFDRGNPELLSNIRIWAVLRDGHGRLINNAPILFRVNRGNLFWRRLNSTYNEFVAPEPVLMFTGPQSAIRRGSYPEQEGEATVYLRGIMDDFFLDAFTLSVSVQVSAEVAGYERVSARPVWIYFTRH